VELSRVEMPAPNITSVAFGGDDLGTLFVCSARENLTEEQLEAYPLSGAVFAIPTSTSGFSPRRFGAVPRS
jgi:sugar lactone lactonase YvrE